MFQRVRLWLGIAAGLALPFAVSAASCPSGSPLWTASGTTVCDAFYAYQDKFCCASHDLSGACIPGPGASSVPECASVTWDLIVSDVKAGKFSVPIPSGYGAAGHYACADAADSSPKCIALDEQFSLYCFSYSSGSFTRKTDAACAPPVSKAINTKATCASADGHCASGSGCDGSKSESAIGTCEGLVSCCRLDPALAAAAKSAAKPTAGPLSLPNPLGNADLPALIGRVISTFLGMVGAISLVVFVFAGVRYMTAGGDEKAVTQAKDTMKYAFIGITIILFAYVITNFFFQVLLK